MAASARQNEYFVPRDGIDREVITADICRYLGNDALVRPGTYEVRPFRALAGAIRAYRSPVPASRRTSYPGVLHHGISKSNFSECQPT